LRGLVFNFASTHQTENPRGFSEVGETKQLLIAIVAPSAYLFLQPIEYALLKKSLSDFVKDAENAFSREHTQWVARKDKH
jgi:hypothetical protein